MRHGHNRLASKNRGHTWKKSSFVPIMDDFSVGSHTELNGAISSDGRFTWGKTEGDTLATASTDASVDCKILIAFGGRCFYRAEIDLTDDHYVQAEFIYTSDQMFLGLAVRKDATATKTYYDISTHADTNQILLRKCIAGVFTTLQTISHTLDVGPTYLFKLEVQGSNLKVYVNDVQVGTTQVDSDIPTGTRVGMACSAGGSLPKEGHIANFEAGE